MKITLIMVSSADGKTTKGQTSGIYSWTSAEDKTHFFSLIAKSSLIIMGRKTYEAARAVIKLKPETLRVVITSHPEEFATEVVPGQLEFTAESPAELSERLYKAGYEEALLVGGSQLNAAFLKARLVNEILMTKEPLIFGQGLSLAGGELEDVALELKQVTRLNQQGTLLFQYLVLR